MIHWPVAFAPGDGLFPEDPENPGWVKLDLETTLTETWKAMIALPKSKVLYPFLILSSSLDSSEAIDRFHRSRPLAYRTLALRL